MVDSIQRELKAGMAVTEKALRQLRETRESYLGTLQTLREQLARVDNAIAALEEQLSAEDPVHGRDLNGFGIVDGTVRLLQENGPMKTGDIARALLARGVETSSKNPLNKYHTVVYSTLDASPLFKRIPGQKGWWELVKK